MKITGRKVFIVFCVCLAAFAVYDYMAANDDVEGNTLSEMTIGLSYVSPVLPLLIGLAAGFVLGHLFWPQYVEKPSALKQE